MTETAQDATQSPSFLDEVRIAFDMVGNSLSPSSIGGGGADPVTIAAVSTAEEASTGHPSQLRIDAAKAQQPNGDAADYLQHYVDANGGTAEKTISDAEDKAVSTLKWTGGTILVVIILALLVLGMKEFREL